MVSVEELFGGELCIWIDQETVHLKTNSAYGDPIELNEDMCEELAKKLMELADSIR